MKIGAFPAEAPFLPALAKLWLSAPQAPHEGLIILPSRRAAQALAGAFLEENGGKALLLPRIIALGAIEEAALALRGGLDLPPAIAPMRRQALLAQLILKMDGARGAPVRLPGAWTLAAELGRLLDEADYAGIDLAETLPGVVEGDLASHWQTTLEFLRIVTHHWPAILASLGQVNPAAPSGRPDRRAKRRLGGHAAPPPRLAGGARGQSGLVPPGRYRRRPRSGASAAAGL